MECMCAQTRPRFILSSEIVLGEWSKNPLYRNSEDHRTHDTASCRTASPTHYRLSYSGPRMQESNFGLPLSRRTSYCWASGTVTASGLKPTFSTTFCPVLFCFLFVLFWVVGFFFCVPQLYLWGSPLLGEIFAYVTVFLIQPLR